ncbi:MAG: HAD family hydrolase, partial [Syntrophales bacterium]|nr:HAD family hydrolase [Syntrophales bacterium]
MMLMRYLALACDYDGTLSGPTGVDAAVIDALERFRNAGKSLILVTGRELEGLLRVFPHIRLFDCVVAENGALVYRPEGREIRILGKAPPEDFLSDLRARGVRPLSAGRVIVSTREPHEKEIIQSIRELGLELQIIFNKGAVMVLPAGLNKAVGLRAAVRELGLSVHNTAGIGDAENDFSFLDDCELSVAVSSALPMLKSRVDFVTRGEAGEGVIETIDALLSAVPEDKLRPAPGRHEISIGVKADGARVCFDPYAANIMLAGTSGSGKSTLALSLMERLIARDYQVCV